MSKKKANFILVEPGKNPEIREIGTDFSSIYDVLDGFFDVVYPFDDQIALICNGEGKILGLPLNRTLKDKSGKIYDIIAGPFLLAGHEDGDFISVPDELIDKYMNLFMTPEEF